MLLIDFGFIILGGLFLFGVIEDGIKIEQPKTTINWTKVQEAIGTKDFKLINKEKTSTGYKLTFEVPQGEATKILEDNIEVLEKAFRGNVIITDIPFSNLCEVIIIRDPVGELQYNSIKLPGTQLLIGYDYQGDPIIADMLETPHLLLTGLSGNGKTGMIRVAIKNLIESNSADIMLLNGFMDDYKGFKINHIINHDSIKEYIEELLERIEEGIKRDKPLYVVFEELGKIKDKELINLTTKLLQYGRHNKIYLIGIIQTATKEELKFKSLFNARCTFKQLEESSYRVVLGCSIEEKLKKKRILFIYR